MCTPEGTLKKMLPAILAGWLIVTFVMFLAFVLGFFRFSKNKSVHVHCFKRDRYIHTDPAVLPDFF